uniref:Xg glycoprotein (Xg blood group) n=1 Tax=Myotis myotis TaxID=51298 RepID=A0A7J7QVK5_MYOMY|nr:Xg glycoprotein (Xg blood group) [Myotis myotis]
MTLTWLTLSTQTRPRSQAQTSTRSRNPRIPRSPEILIPVETSTQDPSHRPLGHSLATPTVETSTQDQSHRPLGHSLATPTGEVTSVMGMTADTRPGPSPGPRQVAVATAMTATEARTVEGAIDPARMDIIMVEAATTRMATRTNPNTCDRDARWSPRGETSHRTATLVRRCCGDSISFLVSFTSPPPPKKVFSRPLDLDGWPQSNPNLPPHSLDGLCVCRSVSQLDPGRGRGGVGCPQDDWICSVDSFIQTQRFFDVVLNYDTTSWGRDSTRFF